MAPSHIQNKRARLIVWDASNPRELQTCIGVQYLHDGLLEFILNPARLNSNFTKIQHDVLHFYVTDTPIGSQDARGWSPWSCFVRSLDSELDISVDGIAINTSTTGHGWLLGTNAKIVIRDSLEIQFSYETYGPAERLTEELSSEIRHYLSDKYTLPERNLLLGSGASTRALLAYDKTSGRQVACKITDMSGEREQIALMKIQNLHLLSRLSHPNIATFHAAYHHKNHQKSLWVIEQLASGGNLRHLLNSAYHGTNPYSWSDAHKMIRQLLHAVQHMHQEGIIHGDLKPDNILCAVGNDRKEHLKITDFDLASYADAPRKYHPGGTKGYWSPERNFKVTWYNTSADMWALGVLVARIIGTGHADLSILQDYPENCGAGFKNDQEETPHHVLNANDVQANRQSVEELFAWLEQRQSEPMVLTDPGDPAHRAESQRVYMTHICHVIGTVTEGDSTMNLLDGLNNLVIDVTIDLILEEERLSRFPSIWFAIVEGMLLKHFLIGLLTRDPRIRMSATKALEHPFMTMTRGHFFYLDVLHHLPGCNEPWALHEQLGNPSSEARGLLERFWRGLNEGTLWGHNADVRLNVDGLPANWDEIKNQLQTGPWAYFCSMEFKEFNYRMRRQVKSYQALRKSPEIFVIED